MASSANAGKMTDATPSVNRSHGMAGSSMRRRASTAKGKQPAALSFPPAPDRTPKDGIRIDLGVATPWTSGSMRYHSFDGAAESPYVAQAQAGYGKGSVSSTTAYPRTSGSLSDAGVGSLPGGLVSCSQELVGDKRKREVSG